MGRDHIGWFDRRAGKWQDNYSSGDPHFAQRVRNVRSLLPALTERSRVLDAGCGTGEIAASIAEAFGCGVTGVDASEGMIARACRLQRRGRVSFERASVTQLPFEDGSFDLVLSISVIEWLDDVEAAVAEAARVLAPGGRWVVSIPNWSSPLRRAQRVMAAFRPDHYIRQQGNAVGVGEFSALARGHGFTPAGRVYHVMPLYAGNLPGPLGPLLGMMCMMALDKGRDREVY